MERRARNMGRVRRNFVEREMGLKLGCSGLVSAVANCTWDYKSLTILGRGFFKLLSAGTDPN